MQNIKIKISYSHMWVIKKNKNKKNRMQGGWYQSKNIKIYKNFVCKREFIIMEWDKFYRRDVLLFNSESRRESVVLNNKNKFIKNKCNFSSSHLIPPYYTYERGLILMFLKNYLWHYNSRDAIFILTLYIYFLANIL